MPRHRKGINISGGQKANSLGGIAPDDCTNCQLDTLTSSNTNITNKTSRKIECCIYYIFEFELKDCELRQIPQNQSNHGLSKFRDVFWQCHLFQCLEARVALARSLMTSSDVVLLDDVLSAVDVHVATALVQEALLGALKDSTRVAGLQWFL